MGFARTSTKFEKADSFLQVKGVSTKKAFVPAETKDDQDSVKWKRRHKRRKKAQNRKAQRGR